MLQDHSCVFDAANSHETSSSWHRPILGITGLEMAVPEHRFAPHRHREYVIGTAISGAETCWWNRASHTVAPGKLLVIEPDHAHEAQTLGMGGWSYRALLVPESALVALDLWQGFKVGTSLINSPTLATDFVQVHHMLRNEDDAGVAEDLLIDVLGRVASVVTPTCVVTPRVKRSFVEAAKNFIADRHAGPLPLKEISDHVGVSRYHLTRVFRDEVGLTPRQYQAQLRIDRATEGLRSGTGPADLAAELGFADQAHFTRVFKSIVGVTPGCYTARRAA